MNSSAVRALALEYKSLLDEPVEGFRVKLLNDDNLFEWSVSTSFSLNFISIDIVTINNGSFKSTSIKFHLIESVYFYKQVGIFGPPETLYQGGYFKVITHD